MVIKERGVAGEPISPDGGVENLDDQLEERVSVSVEEIDPAENLARAPSKALKQKRKSEPKPKVAFKDPVHYGLDELEEGPTREQLIDLDAIESEERMQLIKDIAIVTVACDVPAPHESARHKFLSIAQGKPIMKFRDVQTFAMVIDPATTGEVTATYTRNNNIARITSLVLRSLTLDGVQGTYPAHIGLRITFNNGYRAEVASLQTSELNCYSFVVPVDSQDYAKWFHTNPPGIAFSMPIPGVTQIRMEAVTFSPTGAETTLCTTGPAGVVQAVFEMEFEQ